MEEHDLDVVTGAFGYTGRYITERLLSNARRVRTLTGHPNRPNPFGNQIEVARFEFGDRAKLEKRLEGADTLYITYWIRFPYRGMTFETAVGNTETLIGAAGDAGVRRIVHVSITKASEDSPFPYFRGKARLERTVRKSGLSHAIVRPTVIFGREDILINNIAYVLRRLPVFGIPGPGDYRVRPVSVEDVADICVRAGQREEDEIIEAVGPETFTFEELVRLIAERVASRARIIHVPPSAALVASRVIGFLVRDVLVTKDELEGLMANLVVTDGPTTGNRRLTDWLAQNAATVGRTYASEVSRHYARRR
ncbi:MAG: NAD(P)H-binding protein [Actinomycetota bacterium]